MSFDIHATVVELGHAMENIDKMKFTFTETKLIHNFLITIT